MKILISNDDGWGFDGIRALENVAREFGDVWVVAPQQPMSGISHQMTFEVPMELAEKAPQSFALGGTPADCVRVGVTQLGVEFDWIFSGINKGANLGTDIYISGTVAAAREATFFGCKSLAISQHLKKFKAPFDWGQAEALTRKVIRDILQRDSEPGAMFNVNLPDVEQEVLDSIEIVEAKSDPNPLPTDYQKLDDGSLMYCSVYNDRKRDPDCDIALCFSGHITLTKHQVRP